MHSFNVDNKLLDKNVIRLAIETTCKNKHKRNGKPTRKYLQARRILANIEKYTDDVYEIMRQYVAMKRAEELGETIKPGEYPKAFRPSTPRFFRIICDNGKERDIASVPLYPDQIVHQILILAGKSIFMRGMYSRSCGSIPNRGTHYGKRYLVRSIKRAAENRPASIKYAAQLDITKCYPHVDHAKLKETLRKKFRGKIFVWLCYDIIDSYTDALTGEAPRGIPIGFVTSQWFCNFLLTPLDHYIKEILGISCYVRYMDDMILFDRNKKHLHSVVKKIAEKAAEYGFHIKDNWQVFRFDYITKNELGKDGRAKHRGRAIDFLGFRFFRDKTILRKRNALKIRRAVAKLSKKFRDHRKIAPHEARSLMSRLGALRHCNSRNFYMKHIKPYIKIKKVKEIVSNESRSLANAVKAV